MIWFMWQISFHFRSYQKRKNWTCEYHSCTCKTSCRSDNPLSLELIRVIYNMRIRILFSTCKPINFFVSLILFIFFFSYDELMSSSSALQLQIGGDVFRDTSSDNRLTLGPIQPDISVWPTALFTLAYLLPLKFEWLAVTALLFSTALLETKYFCHNAPCAQSRTTRAILSPAPHHSSPPRRLAIPRPHRLLLCSIARLYILLPLLR